LNIDFSFYPEAFSENHTITLTFTDEKCGSKRCPALKDIKDAGAIRKCFAVLVPGKWE